MLAWLQRAEEPCGFDQFGCVCFQEQETIVLYLRCYLMLFSCVCAHLQIYLLQSVLQQRQNQGDVNDEAQPPSILSYLAACDFDVHGRSKPYNPAETSEADSFSSEDQKGTESRNTTPALDHRTLPLVIIQETCAEERQHPLPNHTTLDILKKTPCVDGFPNNPSSFLNRHKGSRDSFNQTRNHHLTEQEDVSQQSLNAANDLKLDGHTKSIDKTLQEVLNLLKLHDVGQAQLEKLEYQVSSLRDKLKVW